LSACGGNNPPTQPPTNPPSGHLWDFTVSVSDPSGHLIPHASVAVQGIQKAANDFGWAYFTLATGCYDLIVSKDGYHEEKADFCIDRHTRTAVTLTFIAPPVSRLEPHGQIFYQDGKPWRWKGVTAFALADTFCKGEDIHPFLDAYKGFNLLRVFLYWETIGAGIPSDNCLRSFLSATAQRGFYVELVLLTGPKPLSEAQAITDHVFSAFNDQPNLLIELVNEPGVHDKVDPNQLHIPQTSLIWTDGQTNDQHRGLYLTPHTPRDSEWPRRAHDLLEYWTGGGPSAPTDKAWKQPAVADEPAKIEDVGGCVPTDFRAYFGTAAILGAGATVHTETGKYGHLPTPQEIACASAALEGLNAFPEDAPLGPYRRIDEQGQSLRTYVVGNNSVRIRPTTTVHPEAGWGMLDPSGILWRR